MVKSRKYAIVTAALALILVAAVVLTVVLTGNGAFYNLEQEGTASNAAVDITASTGTVPNRTQYIFETLTAHSAIGTRGNGWQPTDRNDAGEYETTLNSYFYLLSEYSYEDLVKVEEGVSSGVYTMTYNGATYKFNNGNTSLSSPLNSLYRPFETFMTDTSFFSNSRVYGLVLTDTLNYNPNVTGNAASSTGFNATLDGGGATLSATETMYAAPATLKDTFFNNVEITITDRGVGYYKKTKSMHFLQSWNGIKAVGFLTAWLNDGMFTNFVLTDAKASGTHQITTYDITASGSAFGMLAGYAGDYSWDGDVGHSQDSNARVYNVAANMTKSLTHEHWYDGNDNGCADMFTAGLIGYNRGASIELVAVNYGNNITILQNIPTVYGGGDGTSHIGGVIGMQETNETFSKVTVTGGANTIFNGDNIHETGTSLIHSDPNTVRTFMGGIIGSVACSGNFTIEGALYNMNYDTMYVWCDNDGRYPTTTWRGMLVGCAAPNNSYNDVRYQDIYLTDSTFANSVGKVSDVGAGTSLNVTVAPWKSYWTSYNFEGTATGGNVTGKDTNSSFIYVDSNTASALHFSDNEDYMMEISAPSGTQGVMWDVTYKINSSSSQASITNAHQNLFMQNSSNDVGLMSTSVLNSTGTGGYLRLDITYASSYTYSVSNGVNGNGDNNKIYNGTQVSYPTLEVNVNSEISSYGKGNLLTSNGYMTLGLNTQGFLTVFRNNGTTGVGVAIDRYYDATGASTSNANIDSIIGSILQLQYNSDGGYQTVEKSGWSGMVNANTYQWSALSTFAFTEASGARKYVFVPAQGSSAKVQITQRPIYLDVVNDSVPYIGQGYALEQGSGGTTFGTVNYTFGTTENDNLGAIIGNDSVSTLATISGTTSAVDAGDYNISATSLTGGSANNYRLEAAPNNKDAFTITPADVTLNIVGGTMTYGTQLADRAAFMNLVHYELDFDDATQLTAFASRDNITLNLNLRTGNNSTNPGQLLFEAASGSDLVGSAVFAYNFPVGAYDVLYENITGSGARNYNVTMGTSQPFNINPATLNIDLGEIPDFTYGDRQAPDTPAYTVGGLVQGDQIITWAPAYETAGDNTPYTTTPFGAGSYVATAEVTEINSPGSLDGIENYNVVSNTQAFDVSKRDTAVQFDYDQSELIYKGSAYTFTATALANAAFNDGDSIADKVTFQAYSDVNRQNKVDATNAGTYYPGAVSAALSANYNVTGVHDASGNEWTSFEVLKATITVNAQTQTIEYSGSEVVYDTSNVTIEGEVSGEEELIRNAIAILYNGSSAVPVDAGTYSVTVQIDGLANYNAVTQAFTGTFVINPMQIAINVTGAVEGVITSKYSGVNMPTFPYTITDGDGEEIHDTLPVTLSYKQGEDTVSSLRNVGSYTVTFTYDGSNGNYAATIATITYTVTHKNLTITVDGVTDGAATQVYNKEVYDPTYTLPGIVSGDVVNPVFTAAGGGEIKNAGEYAISVTLDNSNYTLSGNTSYTLTISKFVITPQEGISSLLINADDLSADYYEDFFTAVVYDADGSDVSDKFAGNITFTLNGGNKIAAEGGDYPVTMTVTLPAAFDAINYEVAEGRFTAHIYRISLGLGFNGIEGSAVTYGDPFSLLAAFTAVGVEGVLTVDNSGNIDVDDIIDDVTALQVTSASLGLTGTTFKPASVDVDNLSTSIEALFTSGVYDQSNMADAGSYTATISVTVHVTYSNSSTKDIIFTMPFAYQVKRNVIGVTLSDVSAYYTDTIDEELLMSGLSFTDGNDSFVTVTSAVLNSAPNAATYTYAIQLNEQTGGYYNYALPADSIGYINVQKLTLKVTVDDNSVQYGYAPTQGASATVEVYRGDTLVEDTTAIASEYSYVFTSDKSIGDGVGTYDGALTANVTATNNFTVETAAGDLEITPRSLEITLNNAAITYGDGTIDITYSITNGSLYGGDEMPELKYAGILVNGVAVTLNKVGVSQSGESLNVVGAAFTDGNYGITVVNNGAITVNPYQITSVTWIDPTATLTYRGTEFASEELYTVESYTHTNGDEVTFTVNYSDTVKNAGNYTATVAVASVTNGSESVNNGNFSVTGIASKSFSVAKANLTITAVGDVEAVEGAITYTATFNNREQTIAQDDITFSYGNRTYNVDDDGALSVSIAYQQNGVTASTVNVGTYNVVVTISGNNFANARLTNVTMVIERWVLDAGTLAQVTDIDIPTDVMYDSQPHGATLVFNDVLTGFNAQYTFTYTNAEGEPVQPVDAGDYTVTLVIDSANVYYATAPDANEGVITIAPTKKFTLSASVPTSTGLDANQVYYSGSPIIPNAQAVITLAGEVTQLPITDSNAFNFTFYELLSQDNGGVDLSTLPGVSGVDAGRYYVNRESSPTAVSSGSYYVFVEFNRDGAYSGNYAPGNTWITNDDGSLTVMVITQGIMSIRMGNVSTDYNGLVGFNGRDVIYSTGTGADIRYWINTDIIQFTGVDLAGMDDLTHDLKTGDIVITVAYNYGVSDTTGEQLFTDLYTYTWAYDPNGNNGEGIRETPVKTFLEEDRNDKQEQISGPYIGSNGFAVYDFGYAGYNANTKESVAALYRISVSVDNTEGSGSEYSSAQEVETDENGPIIIDGVPQMIQVPHTASGSVTVNPATIDFSMFYTNSFYNDGNDALGGEYSELNAVADGQITDEEARDIADYIMRGIAIPTGGELLTMGYQGSDTANVTTTGYTMLLNNVEYNFEVLAADKITIKVTDSNGNEVYSFANGAPFGSGIVNAGEYTFTFTFDAMPGKYESFSYTAMFIQQRAEYHITVEQNEGANLSTQFGTEFNLQGLADQLNVKIELGEGDYTTNTGKYTAFEEAVEAAGGNMSALASFIKLVGDDGSVSSEYGGVTSPVGSYFIYYVYTSINPNLEIVMETANSMITVTQAAPTIMVNAKDKPVDADEGLNIGGQPYTPNTSWNNAVLEQVGVGIEYKPLTAPEGNGTYYTTKNVRINMIEYFTDAQQWTGVENISSVGSYRITVAADDANLEGALENVYIYFEVTKIEAQANIVINDGNSDLVLEGGIYVATFNGASHGVGANVTAGGNEVTAASLQGTINILVSASENGEYVNIAEAPIVTAGSYWVKVTVEGSENYDVTPSAPVQITINKATPTIRFETDGYSVEYSIKGNTISSDDFTFELNGALAPMITANADIYYIKATFGDDGATSTAISAAQTEIAEMVNAFVASGKSNIAEWLTAQQGSGKYAGYEFTSVNGAPAATNVGNYFPVVIFSGDSNYNRSGELVANIPHPYMEVTPAVLTLTTSKTGRSPVSVTYGSEAPKIITEDVTTYINHWFQHGSSELTAEEMAQISYTATLETMNQYSVGNPVGTIANAYVLSITDFESENNNYTYIAADYYVDIEVTPAEVTFDLANVSVSLTSDIADQQAVKLTSEGYTFERVYNGSAFGPLELTYDGEKGLDVIGTGAANADSAKSVNGQGLGTYGIFDISASGGYVQEAVSSAGSYTGSVTITLNNSNYDVTGLGEGNTLTVPVSLVIDKAILQIYFDYLTYTVDKMEPYRETSAPGVNTPGGEQHLGWYEYYTIYTGRNFDYNNRVFVKSYSQDENGKLTAYGYYAGGDKLANVTGIDETDGASGNLAAVGQYNIHLTLNQLAANYKFIDSAGSTVGVDASGNQADLTTLDINVNIDQSPFVAVSNTLDDKLFPVEGDMLTRYFDGTNITASFLKGFLSIEPYKVEASGALSGTVPLTPDRDYAQETITNNVQVTITSGGAPVTSAMYVGDYVMSATFNNASYSMKPIEYAFKIAPTPKITPNVTVKGATERTYNGLDLVPNISLTISVTDYNRVTHTIAVPSFTVNVTYKQTADSAASTFSYGVKNGVADMTQLQGNFRNAGTYTVTLGISNANTSVTSVDVETEFEISRRPLDDDPTIRSSYIDLFNYRTRVNEGKVEAVPVSEDDLNVIVTYNRTTSLVLGEDFEIDFGKDGAGMYTGHYTFDIVGKGNYTGKLAGEYSIGASVGIAAAPDAITYGSDSLRVMLEVNSLGTQTLEGSLTVNFSTGSSSRIVDGSGKTVAQLGVPEQITINSSNMTGSGFAVTFTGLGALNAGDYYLYLVFECSYNGITTQGEISSQASGDVDSKVTVSEAEAEVAAQGVTATITSVNSTSVTFNIKGAPNSYEYSVDGGSTWDPAVKGDNTISGLESEHAFSIMLRIKDDNYAHEGVNEYPLSVALSGTTTADVDAIIAEAEDLASGFNVTGFARYSELLQSISAVSSGDLAARGDEIDAALAEVEEAKAEYVEDLQAAIDSAVSAAEKAAGKASGASAAAAAGVVAGGVAMPVLGIGLIFAAARKRKNKEDDLND